MLDNERDQIIEQAAKVIRDAFGYDHALKDDRQREAVARALADAGMLQPSSDASEDWKRVAQDALAGQALMGAEFEKLRAERDHALAESKRAWKMPNTYVYLVWSANNLEEKVLKAVFSKKILARDYVITWYGSEGRLEQDPDSDSFWVYDGFKDIWITRMEVLS